MADLFISYSREDYDLASAIASVANRRGLTVWWDVNLIASEVFTDEIQKQIKEATVVLVLWSQNSVRSRWVNDEARLAQNSNKLIQARLDDVDPPPGFGSSMEHIPNLSQSEEHMYNKEVHDLMAVVESRVPPRESVKNIQARLDGIDQFRDETTRKQKKTKTFGLLATACVLGLSLLCVALYKQLTDARKEIDRHVTESQSDKIIFASLKNDIDGLRHGLSSTALGFTDTNKMKLSRLSDELNVLELELKANQKKYGADIGSVNNEIKSIKMILRYFDVKNQRVVVKGTLEADSVVANNWLENKGPKTILSGSNQLNEHYILGGPKGHPLVIGPEYVHIGNSGNKLKLMVSGGKCVGCDK